MEAWVSRKIHLLVLLVVASACIQGCATTSVDAGALNLGGPNGYVDFIPQDPLPSPKITYYDSTGQQVTKSWTQLNNQQIRNILSNTHAQISVGKFDGSGNLTYLVAKATAAVGTYRVIMDYCDYVDETVSDPTGQVIGQGRVGVGLRLTADVTTTSANVNLGSLLALGVAASVNQVKGTMTVDSIGIVLAGSAGPILTNATIDETGVQKTLESIAVIQSKIADTTTVLDPQLLAVKPTASAVKPTDVSKKLQ
jgi:hypothetical protein